ncbi:chorion class B protein PC10-like [Vanessa tameamea]|uniref:Chorion class B protein PC10-like n=1 Tax=Vanessa tameamea TaxID=334116 RepID=A0A8B8I2G6_VANTA|nr:chorion class B protein PC10-like [Vanessa tameamea]
MANKIALLACVCFIAVRNISAQCIGAYNGLGLNAYAAGAPFAAPWAAGPIAAAECGTFSPFVPSSGGGFTITSASPIAPTGVTVTSENAYEGPLAVTGVLPFLGAVALEGALPTLGAGTINYGCGNGNIGMLNEDFGYNGLGPLGYNGLGGPLAYEAGLVGPGYRYNGIGCGGYGAYY